MTTSTKVYSGPSFDFEGYNAITAKAPAGMLLFLAQQSLEKVSQNSIFIYFKKFNIPSILLLGLDYLLVLHELQQIL